MPHHSQTKWALGRLLKVYSLPNITLRPSCESKQSQWLSQFPLILQVFVWPPSPSLTKRFLPLEGAWSRTASEINLARAHLSTKAWRVW